MQRAPHSTAHVKPRSETVQVIQLTDTHLSRLPGGTLLGVDTDYALQAVIDLVKTERPPADLLLATGDLSDGGADDAYRRLLGYFDRLCVRNFWLPGNHDERRSMEAAVQDSERLCREVRVGAWQIVLLDSQVTGKVSGELGAAERKLLTERLEDARAAGLFSLVCLHHQPVPVGCAWLDQQMLADAAAFFAILDRYSAVRGVLWGHVHQQVDMERRGVKLMASPSTCAQFAPGSATFKADTAAPGYRWLELHADGRLESGVSRVRGISFNVDLDSPGYL
ncbi:MAG: 3',5'-cyclic-AMP phosphodiesterase [Halioglobus sp.]|nr:3',5'-cyclic-AMP phosphodiesterase [Halioglobus sp.]